MGKATMATGPSILPVVFGASGGSCHAPPQHLWVKLWRRAGMTSGACELSPLARLPPEQPLQPCLHSCGPAAPTQARTPAPAGPFRPRDGPWPAPSVGWSNPSLPPLLIPPQHRGREHPGTEAMVTRSLRAASSLTSPRSAFPPGRQDTLGSSRAGRGGFRESDESVNGILAPVTQPERKSQS